MVSLEFGEATSEGDCSLFIASDSDSSDGVGLP